MSQAFNLIFFFLFSIDSFVNYEPIIEYKVKKENICKYIEFNIYSNGQLNQIIFWGMDGVVKDYIVIKKENKTSIYNPNNNIIIIHNATSRYTIYFRDGIIRTVTPLHDPEMDNRLIRETSKRSKIVKDS